MSKISMQVRKEVMEDKSEKETEEFVNAVLKGKNVAAAKSLEKII